MASAATTSHSQNANQRRNTYTINKPVQLNESNPQLASFQSQSSSQQLHLQRSKQQRLQQSLDQNNNYVDTQQLDYNSTQHHQHNSLYLKQQQQQQQLYNSNDQYNPQNKTNPMYRNNSRASVGSEIMRAVESFTLNHLVWAKLNNFPWWPCKIVCDPNNEFSKIIGTFLFSIYRFVN